MSIKSALTERQGTQVILNADDFGRSAAVNEAVIQAHLEGMLSSTSLMVSGEAAEEAVALAWQTPTLAVGLHVVLIDGPATLPRTLIPHLVDQRGRFSSHALQTGLRYALSTAAQRELALELEAQFDRFAATGLPLSHVNGHLHMHVHPAVFDRLLALAEQYGARGLRVPRDDLWLSLRYDRRMAGTKVAWAFAFGLLARWCMRRLRGRSLAVTHRVYGLMQSGRMLEPYVIGLLQHLRVPTAELYFHPSTAAGQEVLGPNVGDLAVLLSPAMQQAILERGIRLSTYDRLVET